MTVVLFFFYLNPIFLLVVYSKKEEGERSYRTNGFPSACICRRLNALGKNSTVALKNSLLLLDTGSFHLVPRFFRLTLGTRLWELFVQAYLKLFVLKTSRDARDDTTIRFYSKH